MNPALPEPVRWSRRRWVQTVAVVFVLQTGLLLFLSQHEQRLPEYPIFRTAIHLAADEGSAQQLSSLPLQDDPTLLALPNLHGFSGPAWLRFVPLETQPEESSEPPQWLALNNQALGATFSRFVETNAIRPALIVDQPIPALLRYEPNFHIEPGPEQSQLRIDGDLAARPLVSPLPLRWWAHSELLSNSVVQAVVDADGFTLSTVLLTGCGLPEADLHALQSASGARFRPLARAGGVRDHPGVSRLTWGRLVFQWHTLPLPATNLSSTRP